MNDIQTLPAPVLNMPTAAKWRRGQQAFRRRLPELRERYRDQYVAVHEGEIVESGNHKLAVAEKAYARFGYVPIYVGLVSDQPPPLCRIPSPRLLRTRALGNPPK